MRAAVDTVRKIPERGVTPCTGEGACVRIFPVGADSTSMASVSPSAATTRGSAAPVLVATTDVKSDSTEHTCTACLASPPRSPAVFVSKDCRHAMCLTCAEELRRHGMKPDHPVSMPGEAGKVQSTTLKFEARCPMCRSDVLPPHVVLELVPDVAANGGNHGRGASRESHVCYLCARVFRRATTFARHFTRCTMRVPPCPYCGAVFAAPGGARGFATAVDAHIRSGACVGQHCGRCHRVGRLEEVMQCERLHSVYTTAVAAMRALEDAYGTTASARMSPTGLAVHAAVHGAQQLAFGLFVTQPALDSEVDRARASATPSTSARRIVGMVEDAVVRQIESFRAFAARHQQPRAPTALEHGMRVQTDPAEHWRASPRIAGQPPPVGQPPQTFASAIAEAHARARRVDGGGVGDSTSAAIRSETMQLLRLINPDMAAAAAAATDNNRNNNDSDNDDGGSVHGSDAEVSMDADMLDGNGGY